jgi:hypothetical protein
MNGHDEFPSFALYTLDEATAVVPGWMSRKEDVLKYLSPCLVCEGKKFSIEHNLGSSYSITCDTCGTISPPQPTHQTAYRAWQNAYWDRALRMSTYFDLDYYECPFCGGLAKYNTAKNGTQYHTCTKCRGSIPVGYSSLKSIAPVAQEQSETPASLLFRTYHVVGVNLETGIEVSRVRYEKEENADLALDICYTIDNGVMYHKEICGEENRKW